jgi:NADH-quinone oxidoreductase subunit F
MAGVFAGGDCVTGPDSVVSAIGAGKRAASAIDKFLGGTGEVVEPQLGKRRITGTLMEDEQPRTDPALLPADRRAGFAEVEQAFDEEAAVAEASRCLRCDVKE